MQIFLSILSFLVLVFAVLFVINRYVYSWMGLMLSKIDFCEHKSVSVLGDNGYPVPTSFRFDTQYIAREMSKNENYAVNDRYNGGGTVVSRNYDGVIYNLYFNNQENGNGRFKLGTGIYYPQYKFGSYGGEKCTTPSYALKRNVFTIIEDLPLTNEQKNELKQHVHVVSFGNFIKFF
ncbi:MAG TPA: hypothetical protein PKY59_04325 [Pyrinomonadaceae bacterium]|nr:hypothetical protein [Pyrinomonadaceae bacterium]